MSGTGTKTRWAAAFVATCIAAGLAANATAADDESPPMGLERLKNKGDDKLPLGESGTAPSKPSPTEPPAGAKGLGTAPGQGSYSPSKPGGDKGSDPETIGGGTRVRKGSELDDIH